MCMRNESEEDGTLRSHARISSPIYCSKSVIIQGKTFADILNFFLNFQFHSPCFFSLIFEVIALSLVKNSCMYFTLNALYNESNS